MQNDEIYKFYFAHMYMEFFYLYEIIKDT